MKHQVAGALGERRPSRPSPLNKVGDWKRNLHRPPRQSSAHRAAATLDQILQADVDGAAWPNWRWVVIRAAAGLEVISRMIGESAEGERMVLSAALPREWSEPR